MRWDKFKDNLNLQTLNSKVKDPSQHLLLRNKEIRYLQVLSFNLMLSIKTELLSKTKQPLHSIQGLE